MSSYPMAVLCLRGQTMARPGKHYKRLLSFKRLNLEGTHAKGKQRSRPGSSCLQNEKTQEGKLKELGHWGVPVPRPHEGALSTETLDWNLNAGNPCSEQFTRKASRIWQDPKGEIGSRHGEAVFQIPPIKDSTHHSYPTPNTI